jgi:membrane-bound lytic murein transglycosylase D
METLESKQAWFDLREKILSDSGNRISKDFQVPDGLKQRTKFWFDIYTRYGIAHHIIHHARFPWIVYRVLDNSQLLANGKGPLWLRQDRGSKFAKAETAKIKKALRKLSKMKDYTNLGPLERDLFNKLLPVKGKRSKVFAAAAENLRSQLGQRDFFQRGLVNSSKYLPYMEDEFRALNLPTELTRMPFVESSFNEEAYSKVGASGIWQIMPRTGKAYMIVNNHIDERNSPLKATRTAGKLLRSYYKALGNSWPLAITSYNNGIGNIQKAIKAARSRDLATIIERYHRGDFKFASSNFYSCMLASLYAEKYNELIFKSMPREPLQEREVLHLSSRTTVKTLQKSIGLNMKELLKYNRDLKIAARLNRPLPRGFQVHLPPGYKSKLLRGVVKQDRKSKPQT